MVLRLLRWLGRYLSTLILAFILALIVWVSAVVNADPNVECNPARAVPIEFMGKDPGLKMMGDYPTTVSLQLLTPQSVCKQLDSDSQAVRAWVDLSQLGPGKHTVLVHVQFNVDLVRIVVQNPPEITINLEPLVTQTTPVTLLTTGEPPLGYQTKPAKLDPSEVVVSGPDSIITRVKEIRAQIDISGATETITKTVNLQAVDETGKPITGLTISPGSIVVLQPINLLGGYRNVIVKVVTKGIVASGYRLTNYFVSPASVVVFSSDPRLVDQLPGYIETQPLDLTEAQDDFEALVELNLPPGITAVTDSRVLVQVSIAAIESSLNISLPIEVTSLAPGLEAKVAPSAVDVILSGPVPVLSNLKPSDIRIKVDLTGYDIGIHQVIPVVDFLPAEVQEVSILPATVEVTIIAMPTPTITQTPSELVKRRLPTPTPTLRP